MMLHPFRQKMPRVDSSAFVAPGAQIIGDVTIGAMSSIWFNTVLRGDAAPIAIGSRTNIQDGCIGHADPGRPLQIGDEVTVGHAAIIHGCTLGKGTLIGMGAIVLNGAEIGEYALVGAGSLVAENQRIPPYTLSLGSPARVVRELTENDLQNMKRAMEAYVHRLTEYREPQAD